MTYKFTDELLDIVNEQDEVVGQELRSVIYKNRISLIRSIAGFLKNDKGQLWIPRRCAQKTSYPLALDISISGHVGAGESYDLALEREMLEETGIRARDITRTFLGKLLIHGKEISFFVAVFEIPYNKEPVYSSKDFCEAHWLYPEEILDKIKNGDKSKNGLPIMLEKFYSSATFSE